MNRITIPPSIVFVAGGPATGKSTLLKALIPRLDGVCLIDKDCISDSFLKTPDKEKTYGNYQLSWYELGGKPHLISSQHYRDNVVLHTYRAMLELGLTNLHLDISPIIQGNYTGQIAEGYFPQIVFPFLSQRGIDPKRARMLFCYGDKELIAERIRQRADPRDAPKLESEETLRKYLDSQNFLPEALNALDHIKLDAAQQLEEKVESAIHYLTTRKN